MFLSHVEIPVSCRFRPKVSHPIESLYIPTTKVSLIIRRNRRTARTEGKQITLVSSLQNSRPKKKQLRQKQNSHGLINASRQVNYGSGDKISLKHKSNVFHIKVSDPCFVYHFHLSSTLVIGNIFHLTAVNHLQQLIAIILRANNTSTVETTFI